MEEKDVESCFYGSASLIVSASYIFEVLQTSTTFSHVSGCHNISVKINIGV